MRVLEKQQGILNPKETPEGFTQAESNYLKQRLPNSLSDFVLLHLNLLWMLILEDLAGSLSHLSCRQGNEHWYRIWARTGRILLLC